MKYEYKVYKKNVVGTLRPHIEEADIEKIIEKYAADGWELVGFAGASVIRATTEYLVFVFKRPVA